MTSGEASAKKAKQDEGEDQNGVRCPKCGCGHCPVYYTRSKPGSVCRKRQCRHCQHEFITKETVRS